MNGNEGRKKFFKKSIEKYIFLFYDENEIKFPYLK
jgi:hypothetical protein